MPMNLQTFIREGYLATFGQLFDNPARADMVLDTVGFPGGHRPPWGTFPNTELYWNQVANLIEQGVVEANLDDLIAAAALQFPHHPRLRQQGAPQAPPADRGTGGSTIFVRECPNPNALRTMADGFAQTLGVPGPVAIGCDFGDGRVALDLPNADVPQATQLRDALRRALANGGPPPRMGVSANQHRDTLLRELFVEGPDQARFELNDLPASTPTRDVVRAVISQYDDKAWPREKEGKPRNAVIDQQNADDTTRRLDPDRSLRDNGVQEGDTLHVSPEARAGAVNPVVRDEALARVRGQILTFAAGHPGFEVEANASHAPTEYLFRFRAPSWGPPSGPGGQPTPVEEHSVFLILPPDFPMKAPQVFWQTPLFHPNVHLQNGGVCLGVLQKGWRAGMDFAELCQILVDIARYHNYAVEHGLNEEAQRWAVSPEGQRAIEVRGGQSATRMYLRPYLHDAPPVYPLRIKRCDP